MSRSNYGFLSKLLHYLALGSPLIAEASFDLERTVHGREANRASRGRHVFVSGLARAGTTILVRALYESGQFGSLTYRDMPFVLAPGLWRSLSRASRRDRVAEERAHGDGILVDFDSPEALDEVFWRVFCGDDYIRSDRLLPMRASEEVVEKFRAYVALVLRDRQSTRYLSKNNNNVLRFASIASAFPDAAILIPFRKPAQHANSLMKQHQRFLARHAADSFSRRYMSWLGHHEFGADHRPFAFRDDASVHAADDLNYWLELWLRTYAHIMGALPSAAILVSYERLCEETREVWERLRHRLDLPGGSEPDSLRTSLAPIGSTISPELLRQANELHRALTAASI